MSKTLLDQLKAMDGVTVSDELDPDGEICIEVSSSDQQLLNAVKQLLHKAYRHVQEPIYNGVARFRIMPEHAARSSVFFHDSDDEVNFTGTDFSVKRTGFSYDGRYRRGQNKIEIKTGHHEFELVSEDGYLTITMLNNGEGKKVATKIRGNSVHITDSRHRHILYEVK